MKHEVLIYIDKIKHYFSTNEEAREYFISDSDEDIFFEHLADISEKNLEVNGQPELTYEQLELLRRTAKVIKIARAKYHYSDDGLFLFYENYPPISMN